MKTDVWSFFLLAFGFSTLFAAAMDVTKQATPSQSEILAADGYPGRFSYNSNGIFDHSVRLLTQLRTHFRSHDAKIVKPSQPTLVRMLLAEAFYTAPGEPRFLHLGTVVHKGDEAYKGWGLALPMSASGSSTRTNIEGFALFTVYPKYVDNTGHVVLEPQVYLHGYVHVQNVDNILRHGGSPQKNGGERPFPGAFVSLDTVFADVRHAPVQIRV
ncbi:hypothetical protein EX895_003052 [Sporisorium graminicola]|uniref:Uncharacterized protein n=1 Tax=Sporisorium graminicola TaxID=280036 RepID=A0A4U7KUX5_9BASI|nr:hypothetical protein EX895_003052 [Sporisorium graminicola]TKY87956.1 hypothetical protein EX895_003052 [Sporisorium graminicola]